MPLLQQIYAGLVEDLLVVFVPVDVGVLVRHAALQDHGLARVLGFSLLSFGDLAELDRSSCLSCLVKC